MGECSGGFSGYYYHPASVAVEQPKYFLEAVAVVVVVDSIVAVVVVVVAAAAVVAWPFFAAFAWASGVSCHPLDPYLAVQVCQAFDLDP